MKKRWPEIVSALLIAAWLGLFTLSCSPPAPPPGAGSGSSAGAADEEAPLDQPGSAMEDQAEQGELAPPAQEVHPIEPDMGGGHHHN